MVADVSSGRANQKQRTRSAIVTAARELVAAGGEVSMPSIAQTALVSEATAYRYFPDLPTLLSEVLDGTMADPGEVLRAVADSADPVERIGFATRALLGHVLARQGAVRAMIAASITRPDQPSKRPAYRIGLIDEALLPAAGSLLPDDLARLKEDLAIVVSAEAVFTLTDVCGLPPEAAVASAVRTAQTITRAAVAKSR